MSATHDHRNPAIDQRLHERLCAYLLGELDEGGRRRLEAELERDPVLREERVRLEATLGLVRDALPEERLSEEVQAVLRAAAERGPEPRRRFTLLRGGGGLVRLAAAAVVLLVGGLFAVQILVREDAGLGSADDVARAPHMPTAQRAPAGAPVALEEQREVVAQSQLDPDELDALAVDYSAVESYKSGTLRRLGQKEGKGEARDSALGASRSTATPDRNGFVGGALDAELRVDAPAEEAQGELRLDARFYEKAELAKRANKNQPAPEPTAPLVAVHAEQERTAGRYRGVGDTVAPEQSAGGKTDADSKQKLREVNELLADNRRQDDGRRQLRSSLVAEEIQRLQALGYSGGEAEADEQEAGRDGLLVVRGERRQIPVPDTAASTGPADPATTRPFSSEDVEQIGDELIASCRIQTGESPADMFFRCWGDNPYVQTAEDQLSTFSIDVDTASYTLARSYLQSGRFPEKDQIRTEEFVNYFRADRPAPSEGEVFAIELEAAPSLFHADPRVEMLRVTVRGKDVDAFERQPLALTFVIDVSGSMKEGGRLEQVKEALGLLLGQLSYSDSIAVVAFSNDARVVSGMVSAAQRGQVEDAILALAPQGGTNVEAGLLMGFELAAGALTPHAVNRVVFLSDGVGNIGETHQERLLAKVATFRERGIYLNTVGVGMGNHNDEFLEQLADHGDGLCQYVDSAREAKKVLVDEFTKTLQPIARDVKIQVDFAPALVASYRQLGYENRAIADELFRDDAVDAGEVNAGHQVTALYEVVRTGAAPHSPQAALPFATVRVRYKPTFPVDHGVTGAGARAEAERAEEITASIRPSDLAPSFAAASDGYRRSVLVAQFAELLRRSVNARGDSLDRLVAETKKLAGQLDDPEVTEFLGLVETALPRLREIEAADRDELAVLVDELCRQHYEDGSRLALGEELPEEEGAERERTAARLEERIREMVQERYAVRRR